ncbi:MAG: hypothetical protein ABSB11_07675 [Sedimentisphaerales bacterium]|jgi:hypothetical protein
MNNKIDETDTIYGKIYWVVPKSDDEFSENGLSPARPDYKPGKIQYKDPVGSRELIKQLLGVVNTEGEYDFLLKELAELDAIIAFQSIKLNGGEQKWQR